MAIGSYINWNKIMKGKNNMIKMFYSGTYKVRHEKINEDNVLEMLKDDIRSKIVGNVKDTVYASDGVIIPIQCEFFALEGIAKLLNTIKIIKSNLNPALRIEGFLLTMYDGRLRLSMQVHDEVRRHFGDLVFDTVIARNVRLSEAPSHGMSVLEYDRHSRGAKNYINLAKELIRRSNA